MTKHSILRAEIKELKKKPVKDRTEEEHFKLIKAFGGVRNYLLSMGKFIGEEEKMYCRKCLKKGKKVSMTTDIKEKEYVCPKCNHKIKWQK